METRFTGLQRGRCHPRHAGGLTSSRLANGCVSAAWSDISTQLSASSAHHGSKRERFASGRIGRPRALRTGTQCWWERQVGGGRLLQHRSAMRAKVSVDKDTW